jgi:preprotein translocase subunit SecA
MVSWILKAVLGSKNQRELRRIRPVVEKINKLDKEFESWSDEQFREKTAQWKAELSKIDDPAALARRLNEILPEAFAAVKNVARRLCGKTWLVCDQPVTWNMVHFDVQLIGGIALHEGNIAEMATGEGKTLVATCPLYLNALTGRGVHLITVNDYLARRDAEWMGEIFKALGVTVGCIQHDQDPSVRKAQYDCDITYGTNSEFGFDYLRDNGMATTKDQQVQRGYYYAIVDEVDSILIDEARTPLIISGPATVSSHQYDRFKPLVEQLVRRQTMLCNRLMSEAREALEKKDLETGGRLLFKVKLGQPRNKGLLRAMEDPENRKALDKAELSFYQDSRKEDLVALKEELYFTIDEKHQEADLSEQGRSFLNPDDPQAFTLPDLIHEFTEIDLDATLSPAQKDERKRQRQQYCDAQAERIHNISQLLRAYCLFEKDVDYVVEENKVVIVDEHTGRKMPGRRWSDGLHQAVEAKEGVQIDRETQTLATITIQNYFRLYHKLAGMTGTAETEANEFHDIYKLDVLVIPTNRPVIRKDNNDRIYKTRREKYSAAVDEIKACHAKGQPVLVGTASVEASELLSRMLKREKIPHNVLNAKYHRQEAEIVARAGQRGTVTISTNMAGRGTDIKLGDGVADLGGLHVLGTERHESRRVDRQLRGRCARQGDPGSSRFYVSFEDDLMRNFGASERMTSMMERFGLKDGEELEHPWLNKSVETAQKRVEQRNYLIRKRTLDFDDVMNKQREVIYSFRNETLETSEPRKLIFEIIDEVIPDRVKSFLESPDGSDPDYDGLLHWANTTFPLGLSRVSTELDKKTPDETAQFLVDKVKQSYLQKVGHEEADAVVGLERYIILNAIDRLWQEHLYAMDGLREGIYLRSYGQKDPLVEYKAEAYEMFSQLMASIKGEVLSNLFRSTTNLMAFEHFLASLPISVTAPADTPQPPAPPSGPASGMPRPAASGPPRSASGVPRPVSGPPRPASGPVPGREKLTPAREKNEAEANGEFELVFPASRHDPNKVGRNDPCPCGSGKKFKNCCGRQA